MPSCLYPKSPLNDYAEKASDPFNNYTTSEFPVALPVTWHTKKYPQKLVSPYGAHAHEVAGDVGGEEGRGAHQVAQHRRQVRRGRDPPPQEQHHLK